MRSAVLLATVATVAAKQYSKGFVRQPRDTSVKVATLTDEDYAAAPETWDWSKEGKTTPIKDQGMCGSCWAYSATEGIESSLLMQNLTQVLLAPQQIISCDEVGAAGCNGGDLPSALDYVKKIGGIEGVKDCPDTSANNGQNGTCCAKDASKAKAKVNSYAYAIPPCASGDCKKQDEEGLAAALYKYGPLSICVNAGDGHWDYYESGIWPPAAHPCASDWDLIDHCVQLVGYDKTASTPYWKIKNSWGDQWGEDGFIRLQMGVNSCGVADEVVYVDASPVKEDAAPSTTTVLKSRYNAVPQTA